MFRMVAPAAHFTESPLWWFRPLLHSPPHPGIGVAREFFHVWRQVAPCDVGQRHPFEHRTQVGAQRHPHLGEAGGGALVSPMQGTIVKIVATEGQHVSAGDTIVVLEAMKMEQPLTAHKDGTVTGLAVQVGQTVPAGEVICELRD